MDPGEEIPRFRIPERSLASSSAYQIIHDELMLDGNARLNLATFVTTWMEPEAERLMAECASKNMIDKDEYPQTAEIEKRCCASSPASGTPDDSEQPTGCSTTGSSEACMLGGLALKWRWRQRREAAGLPTDRPNLVMGTNVQVCWEKFCRYFDVEPRQVPVGPELTHLTQKALQRTATRTRSASWRFSARPTTAPTSRWPRSRGARRAGCRRRPGRADPRRRGVRRLRGAVLRRGLEWDFRVPRVQSINASGHKFGLVYPGVGWIIWRDHEALPEDLVFKVEYLGGEMPTFALNFSRPGAQVVAQYYKFLRLGLEGYRRVQESCCETATWLAGEIEQMEQFDLVTREIGIPVLAFKMSGDRGYTVYDVSEALRARGWLVPAYPMPPDLQDTSVLRIVVRNGLSRDMAGILMDDLKNAVERLEKSGTVPQVESDDARAGFHH